MSEEFKIIEERGNFYSTSMLFFFIVGGFVLSQFASLFLILVYYQFDMQSISGSFVEDLLADDNGRSILLGMQGISSSIMFIGSPLLYLWMIEKKTFKALNPHSGLTLLTFVLIFLICFTSTPFNALLIEWNEGWDFPDFMQGFEEWAFRNEKDLKKLTDFLVDFNGIPQLFLGILCIAVIPAIGEELLFRGIIQNKLAASFNIHFSIFLAAFIFSAIHLQFYGLIPRMFLGVLFGYLYYWSGNLWTAIFAHFVNNAFAVVMMYLYKQGYVEADIDRADNIPLLMVMAFSLICTALMFYFKKIHGREAISQP